MQSQPVHLSVVEISAIWMHFKIEINDDDDDDDDDNDSQDKDDPQYND